MTYAELVRLKLTPKQVNNIVLPKGVDVTWLDYDYPNGEVTARIIASEFDPDPQQVVYKERLQEYINTLPVCKDGIRWSKFGTEKLRKLEGFIGDSSMDGQYDHKRSNAKDSHYVELTKERLAEVNSDMVKSGRKPLKPDKTVERNGVTYYLLLFGTLQDN